MDDQRFDRLARAVAHPSRRGLIRGLAAGALGAALGLPSRAAVEAATCRERGANCTRPDQCCGSNNGKVSCKKTFSFAERKTCCGQNGAKCGPGAGGCCNGFFYNDVETPPVCRPDPTNP